MDILRAFTYIFDDRDWASKIAICAIVAGLSFLLTPLLVGAVGWAALLGYQVALVRNIRAGVPALLPTWDDFGGHITAGVNGLVAFLIYNLPNILIGLVLMFTFGLSGEAPLTGGVFLTAVVCCLLPFLFVYNAIVYPMFALGMGRYVDEPYTATFFDVGALFGLVRLHTDLVIKWLVASLLVGLFFLAILIVPVIGWIIAAALVTPVFGHLVGQFALAVFGKPLARRPSSAPLR